MNLPKNTLITPVFRTMFPALFVPEAMEEGQIKRYKVEAVFGLDAQKTPEFQAMRKAFEAVSKNKWPKGRPPKFRSPFRPGSERLIQREDGEFIRRTGYEGECIFCSFSSQYPISVVDRNRLPLTDETAIYPGVRGRAIVKAAAYATAANQGVSFFLQVYQLVGGGERIIPPVEQFLPDLPAEDTPDTAASSDFWGNLDEIPF